MSRTRLRANTGSVSSKPTSVFAHKLLHFHLLNVIFLTVNASDVRDVSAIARVRVFQRVVALGDIRFGRQDTLIPA